MRLMSHEAGGGWLGRELAPQPRMLGWPDSNQPLCFLAAQWASCAAAAHPTTVRGAASQRRRRRSQNVSGRVPLPGSVSYSERNGASTQLDSNPSRTHLNSRGSRAVGKGAQLS